MSSAQTHYNTAVPQNQAQLQQQQQAAKNQQQKGGLFSSIGRFLKGDEDPKNAPPIAPANVGAQNMAQNAGQAQEPQQYSQGTAVTPPRPQSAAGHSAGGYTAAPRNTTGYVQPTQVPSNTMGMQQTTASQATTRPTMAQTMAGSTSRSLPSSTLGRMEMYQQKAAGIDLSAPSTDNRVASRGTSGPPTPPPMVGGQESTSTAARNSRSLSTNDDREPTGRNTTRPSLSTSDESDEGERSLARKIEIPPMKNQESTPDPENFGKPVSKNAARTSLQSELVDTQTERPTARPSVQSTTPEQLPVIESRRAETPVPRGSSTNAPPTNADRPRPVVKNDGLIRQQTPAISVVTKGPDKITVGKEESYTFVVTNNSNTVAEDVVINIELPRWAENTQAPELSTGSTALKPHNDEYGIFQWQVGRLDANKSETLVLHIVLKERKSFELKFTFDFKQSASHAAIEVQQPVLKMEFEGPEEVLWGAEEKYNLRIRNIGNGDANDIFLKLSVAGVTRGETTIKELKIGEQHMIDVFVTAKEAHELEINVQATGPYGLSEETSKQLIVKRAELELDIDAPGMQYVNNIMEYIVIARNVGTANSQDSKVEASLPLGVKYVSSSHDGVFDADSNRVTWDAGTIPIGSEFVCTVTCEAKREGECRLEAKATEKTGLVLTTNAATMVEAIADLELSIEKPQGPIEVGVPTEYVIIVDNRGTKAAENIDISAYFSEAVEPNSVTGGKAKINVDRREIVFDRVPVLAANDSLQYRIKVTGHTAGNHKMHAAVVCQSTETSLTSQQMSRFYQGRNSRAATPATPNSSIGETSIARSNNPAMTPDTGTQNPMVVPTFQPSSPGPAPTAPNVPQMNIPEMGGTPSAQPAVQPVAPGIPSMGNTVSPIAPQPAFAQPPVNGAPANSGSATPAPNTLTPNPLASSNATASPGTLRGSVSSQMHAESSSQNNAAHSENGTLQPIPSTNLGQLPVNTAPRALPRTGSGITSLSAPPAISPTVSNGSDE